MLQKYLREKYPDFLDSFKFAEKIRDTRGAVNSTLIGLDIESLYPSIPLEETLNLAADILKEIDFKNLERENIIKLLKFCTSDLTFQFNGKFYKQTSGVPMGSPLAMALSEIFLKQVEKDKIIPNFQKLGINKYFRYVDDIFIIGKENLNTDNLLLNFNSVHKNLKFTMELERNSCLNFLDVLVVKVGDRFGTRVFRKSINPLTLHHWNSAMPFKYKINLIKTMIHRVFSISSGNFLKSELKTLENIFLNSGYPLNIIKKEINNFFENLRKQNINQIVDKNEIYFGIDYNGPQSEKFLNKIKKFCGKYSPGFLKFSPFYKSKNSLLKIFSKKIKCYNKFENPCVYKINCLNCNQCYVGQTGRTIAIRRKEHERLSEFSAVSNHVKNTGHSIDFQNPEILCCEGDLRKRLILESLFLKNFNHFVGNTGKQLNLF